MNSQMKTAAYGWGISSVAQTSFPVNVKGGFPRQFLTLIVVLFASSCSISYSQVPLQFTYQGRLTDADGVPVTTAVTGVFQIIRGGDGMSPVLPPTVVVHAETNVVTPDVNGAFSQLLGAQPGIPISLMAIADGVESRWISVSFGGVELLPRQQLVSVPYAIQAIAGVPPGTILPYGGTNAPPGFLMCDGQDYQRSAYPGLFAAIGTAFGAPDGNRFNVPDFRGRFLRGQDGGTGRDPDRGTRIAMNSGGNPGDAVGSLQPDAFKSHQHVVDPPATSTTVSGYHSHQQNVSAHPQTGGSAIRFDWNYDGTGGQAYSQGIWTHESGNHSHHFDISPFNSVASGGNETRPINAYVNFIIKY